MTSADSKINSDEMRRIFIQAFGSNDKQLITFRRVCDIHFYKGTKTEQRLYSPDLSPAEGGEEVNLKKVLAAPKWRSLHSYERKSYRKERSEYVRSCVEILVHGKYELEVEKNSSDELQGKKLVCTSETQGFFDVWNDFKFQTFTEARSRRDRIVPRKKDLIMIKTSPLSNKKTSEKKALVWCLVTDQFMKLVCKMCYPRVADWQGPDDRFQPEESDYKKRERSWYFSGNRLMTQNCWRKRILGYVHNEIPLNKNKSEVSKMFRWGRAEPEAAYVHTWAMFFLLMEYQEAPGSTNVPNNLTRKRDGETKVEVAILKLKKWDVDLGLLKHLNARFHLGITKMPEVDDFLAKRLPEVTTKTPVIPSSEELLVEVPPRERREESEVDTPRERLASSRKAEPIEIDTLTKFNSIN